MAFPTFGCYFVGQLVVLFPTAVGCVFLVAANHGTYKVGTTFLMMTYEVLFPKQLATIAAALQEANFPMLTYEVFFRTELATVAAALQQANFPMLLCNCFAG